MGDNKYEKGKIYKITDINLIILLLKKMIACINIGLLEKTSNTAKKSIAFSKMIDAFYYQEKYGGNINIIAEVEEGDEIEDLRIREVVSEENHYVWNISDTKTLMNG